MSISLSDADFNDEPVGLFHGMLVDVVERAVRDLLLDPSLTTSSTILEDLDRRVDWLEARFYDEERPVSAIGLLTSMVTGCRIEKLPFDPAVRWVTRHLGAQAGADVKDLVGSLSNPRTLADVWLRLGDGLLGAMLWLVTGMAATAGRNTTDWLRDFVPDRPRGDAD